jgi:hypothetical protein
VPLAVGVIAVLLLLAWGGMEVNHVIHAYPVQFWLGVTSVLVIAFAFAAAKFRLANQRVPLRPAPPALPPAVRVTPELKAAPVLRAIASTEEPGARPCEGPLCTNKVDDDPWTARVEEDGDDHVFCSRSCAQRWTDRRSAPSL